MLGIMLAAGLLAGCGGAAGAADETWVEPEWFAQVRTEKAEFDELFMECLNERGIEGRIVPGPMSPAVFSDTGSLPEGSMEALEACRLSIERPTHWFWELDEDAYQRMLDGHECVIRHTGQRLPEPPAMERFFEISGRRSAQGQVIRHMSFEEAHALNDACPQQIFGSWTPLN
jgi:hypothetical protein